MTKQPTTYSYTREDLLQFSEKTNDKLKQDVSRDDFNVGNLGEVAVWLAKNGSEDIRRKIAAAVLPDILKGIGSYVSEIIMPSAFARKQEASTNRARKISRSKRERSNVE